MKCPVCNNEMEKGKSTFTSIQGLGQMILSFTSDEEAKKGLFKRQSHDKIIMSGTEAESYYCSKCKSIITITEED